METGGEGRWRPSSACLIPVLACVCLLFIADVYQFQYYATPSLTRLHDTGLEPRSTHDGFVVKTPGCRIPYMDPFDHRIKQFLKNQPITKCNKGIPALYEANRTHVFRINSSLAAYNLTSKLHCCYTPFWRRRPTGRDKDKQITFGKTCKEIHSIAEINEEFIKLTCKHNKTIIYTDFFSFVPVREPQIVPDGTKMNVMVIGLDALSRLNFHRQMPKTVDYLHKLGAVELLGYNKVADNTFPNLIPVLTGLTKEELIKGCWNDNERYDSCPFIWKKYRNAGYLTSLAEDAAWMGLFAYWGNGFVEQPTNYMWGVFDRLAEDQIGNDYDFNSYQCIGARETYKVFLDYAEKFMETQNIAKKTYFGFHWQTSLTHDYLNKPKQGDESFRDFFKNLAEGNLLNNTVLIVMSDHGIRWGDIRRTYQGRMEERLPFVFFLLPETFKQARPEAYRNLVGNIRRLTTPFDLHETFIDLLGVYNQSTRNTKAYSLFTEISPERTCDDAGITSHWCTCQQSTEIDVDDAVVNEVANYAVDYMNGLLDKYAQCANLTLDVVKNAQIMTHGDHILNGDKTKDYMVTFTAQPGAGLFETTVRYTVVDKKSYYFEVMGTISRLNLYGKQSWCIDDYFLKLYCYCTNSNV